MSHLQLSHMSVPVKNNLLLSNFGCCISNGYLFRLFRDHNSCCCAVLTQAEISLFKNFVSVGNCYSLASKRGDDYL